MIFRVICFWSNDPKKPEFRIFHDFLFLLFSPIPTILPPFNIAAIPLGPDPDPSGPNLPYGAYGPFRPVWLPMRPLTLGPLACEACKGLKSGPHLWAYRPKGYCMHLKHIEAVHTYRRYLRYVTYVTYLTLGRIESYLR